MKMDTQQADILDELLGAAKNPDQFTKYELGGLALEAATEIMKLRETGRIVLPFGRAKTPKAARNSF